MSLLLDALKEAEARKREAPAAAAAARSLEVEGALALAEDSPPRASEPSRPAVPRRPPTASPVVQAHAPAATPPPAAEPACAPRRAATAAETLLAARAARSSDPAVGHAVPAAGTAAPASRSGAGAVHRPRGRRQLYGLIAVMLLVALVLGGLLGHDHFFNEPEPAFVPPHQAAAAPTDGASSMTAEASPAESAAWAGRESAVPSPRSVRHPPTSDPPREEGSTVAAPVPHGTSLVDAGAAPDPAATAPSTTAAPRISISREPALLEAAWSALQSGELPQAEDLYRRALAAEPGQVDAQLGLAVIAQARGDDAAARRGFRIVLESVPDHPRAWAGLAELAGDGDVGVIESRLRQLLAARASAPLHFALGNLLARQQRWADAQAEFFAAASLEPKAADYVFNVAVALDRLGKPGAALPWYERGLDLAAHGRPARFDAAAVGARITQLRSTSP